MTPLVVTPGPLSVSEIAHLDLSDGQTSLDLLGDPPWGLYLVEFTPPVVARENTYVPGPEGQRRVRSRPQNAVGSARVRIDRQEESSASFADDIDALQMMVESAHKRKGTLTFEPPNLDEVTYDIESCQITEAPADGPRMTKRMQEFVIEFECRPYGRLATIIAWTSQSLSGPLAAAEIDAADVPGHVDALAELTLTDTSSEDANFVEFGVGQQGYDPDAGLLIDDTEMDVSGDFVGTQTGTDPVTTALTTTSVPCCGTPAQTMGGRQKIAALVHSDADDVWLRFSWRLDEGPRAYGRWIELRAGATLEPTVAVIDVGDATRWHGRFDAFVGSGTATLLIHGAYVIPAEICGRVRDPGIDDHALYADQAVRFTHEGVYREDSNGDQFARHRLDGDALRIPAATAAGLPSLLVVRRRLNDVDAGEESAGRESNLTARLEITPRVALY
jgi:hypothetical protein